MLGTAKQNSGEKIQFRDICPQKLKTKVIFGGQSRNEERISKSVDFIILEVNFALFFYFLDYFVEPHFPQCKRFKIIFAKCLLFIELAKL